MNVSMQILSVLLASKCHEPIYTVPVSLEESSSTQPEGYSVDEENASEDSPEEPLHRPLSGDEVSSHFHGFLVENTKRAKGAELFIVAYREQGIAVEGTAARFSKRKTSKKTLQEKLKEQTKDVDTAPSKEVSLYALVWHGRRRNARKLLIFRRHCAD
ncbi:hypothetical protein POTOM_017224 [Populus tomentosa]|uniref:Uncharacterized protein n=1 Tax=Populus tomentosa TaxID=118781 RepID=A0A8X7ZUK2_POPTO|nr:hypothetical protein POTOM_017224 [Populus tomentosa]